MQGEESPGERTTMLEDLLRRMTELEKQNRNFQKLQEDNEMLKEKNKLLESLVKV